MEEGYGSPGERGYHRDTAVKKHRNGSHAHCCEAWQRCNNQDCSHRVRKDTTRPQARSSTAKHVAGSFLKEHPERTVPDAKERCFSQRGTYVVLPDERRK